MGFHQTELKPGLDVSLRISSGFKEFQERDVKQDHPGKSSGPIVVECSNAGIVRLWEKIHLCMMRQRQYNRGRHT
jgi:hypothetical protein